jgi:hypothetical protein
MTSQQKLLARHALGLPNEQRRSYRNRYYTSEGTPAYALWCEMVEAGHARGKPEGGRSYFWLLESGARLALDEGETLCSEDFPS